MPGVWQDMSQLQKTASFQEHVPVSEKRPLANGRRRRRRVWLRVSIVCRISHFRSPTSEWRVLCDFISTRTAACDLKLILVHKLNIPDWKNVVAQKYKPWMMRPQVFMGIHVCLLAKQIQRSFDKSLHCHEILVRMQIPKVLSARHAFVVVVVFCLPRKLFMSYLMIFKCAFVICLCSLIVDICYVSRTGEAVSLLPQNLETVWCFLDALSPKASIK